MASSKPQSYYICLLKALRETSSQSQSIVGACTKVTKLILLCPDHNYSWGGCTYFPHLCTYTSSCKSSISFTLVWLKDCKGCKTDRRVSKPTSLIGRRTRAIQTRWRIKYKEGAFDQWPRLRGNGFHIITTVFIIGWVSVRSPTPPLSFPVEKPWSIWRDVFLFTHKWT